MPRVATVEGGLAAAGLGLRHLDRAAGLLEELDGGEADARPHRVDQAGDEQSNARRRLVGKSISHRSGLP